MKIAVSANGTMKGVSVYNKTTKKTNYYPTLHVVAEIIGVPYYSLNYALGRSKKVNKEGVKQFNNDNYTVQFTQVKCVPA